MGGWDAPWHWVVLAILVVVLLGYKKLPDAARSVGRSLRIFKTEIKGMTDDDKARTKAKEEAETKALPSADLVKREAPTAQPQPAEPQRDRPRPSPSPHSRA